MRRKWLAIGIILLFIGVIVTPSINLRVVKASHDDDLIEVTTQVCGIDGFGDTTVKLTREQYRGLEEYLVEFRARLKQTTTRVEAIPLLKEAVVELDTYDLLPKGMSVEQAQNLILGSYENKNLESTIETVLYNHLHMEDHYFFSFVSGIVQDGNAMGILYMIGAILTLLSIFPSPFLFLFGSDLALLLGMFLLALSYIIVTVFPLAVLQQINIFSGNLTLCGPGGSLQFTKGLINGFNGIKITRITTNEMHLLGCAVVVSYAE